MANVSAKSEQSLSLVLRNRFVLRGTHVGTIPRFVIGIGVVTLATSGRLRTTKGRRLPYRRGRPKRGLLVDTEKFGPSRVAVKRHEQMMA